MAEIIAYIVFCLLAGLCGSQRRMGFFGTFIISLLLTPVVVLVALLLTGPSSRHMHHWWHHSDRQSS
jgi:peptidoglycan/LPS O-acetylase OafA/YrhL